MLLVVQECSLRKADVSPRLSPLGTFREEERLRLSNRNSILMMQNLSGIQSEAIIGRRSSFIVLGIVYKWQTKDKRLQRSVNTMNLLQNSQYLWSIFFSRRSIWVLLELIRRCTQHFSNVKLNKFAFGTPWLPDLLCKHWFMSSVWNFCRWVADVPPCETSLSGDEQEETSAVHRLARMMMNVNFDIREI